MLTHQLFPATLQGKYNKDGNFNVLILQIQNLRPRMTKWLARVTQKIKRIGPLHLLSPLLGMLCFREPCGSVHYPLQVFAQILPLNEPSSGYLCKLKLPSQSSIPLSLNALLFGYYLSSPLKYKLHKDSDFAPCLFAWMLYPQCLKQCLAHSNRCSINTFWFFLFLNRSWQSVFLIKSHAF